MKRKESKRLIDCFIYILYKKNNLPNKHFGYIREVNSGSIGLKISGMNALINIQLKDVFYFKKN